jgi:adenylate kinase
MPVRDHALWVIASAMTEQVTALALILQSCGQEEIAKRALKDAEDARDALTKEAIRAQIQPERIGSSMPSFVCKSSDS